MKCATCGSEMVQDGTAVEIYRLNDMIITVTGIPAVHACTKCNNAVIEWETAQQIEDLVQPLLSWAASHTLPNPQVTVAFAPERRAA